MEGYLTALASRGSFADFFATDIVLEMVPEGQMVRGHEAVEAFVRGAHEQAFDAKPELVLLVVEGDHAAAELIFVARHTGEFMGIPATGKQVRAPYTAFCDVEGGRITSLRLYGLGGLAQQLQS
jgi:ketosteroid isomerase-like protein